MADGRLTPVDAEAPPGNGRSLSATTGTIEAALTDLHREAFGRLVATLTRLTRDLTLAEDAVQEAFLRALRTWSADDLPEQPVAWLARTARNAAIDRIRRGRLHDDRIEQIASVSALETTEIPMDLNPILRDDMLRLIFTCCHPAIAAENRVALSLRTLCGLETAEIARAFLIPEKTLAQRLVRAKGKILEAGIGYRVPEASELDDRLPDVLSVIYLIFNEAYFATRGDEAVRGLLADQAIRLLRTLRGLLPEQGEVESLLALMLLQHSRREARVDGQGELVLLADQDRSLWNAGEIAEGLSLIGGVFERGNGFAPFALQAAIAALHAQASEAAATDWAEICLLYEHLMELDPSPIVALNHGVAIGERDGAAAGLDCVDRLQEVHALGRYHLFHAARADLLRRTGRRQDAAEAYRTAIGLAENQIELRFLRRRLEALGEARD